MKALVIMLSPKY